MIGTSHLGTDANGGKFANGARSAAFVQAFNGEFHQTAEPDHDWHITAVEDGVGANEGERGARFQLWDGDERIGGEFAGSTLSDRPLTDHPIVADGTYQFELIQHPDYGRALLIANGGEVPVVWAINPARITNSSLGTNVNVADDILMHREYMAGDKGSAACFTMPQADMN